MMQKKFATILAAAMLQLALPAIPAHAASLSESLLNFAAENPNLLQQVIEVKQDIDQGNRTGALNKVIATVVANDDSNISSVLAGGNLREAVQTQIIPGVEERIRQEVQQRVGDKLLPYQNQITAVASLLNLQPEIASAAVVENQSLAGAPENYKKVVEMTATAYAPGYQDNGKWGDQTYMSGTVKKGIAAVDPSVIPMGSRIWVEGYGEAIAEDQGSAIKGNRIDLAFNTRQEALNYGMQNVKVYVLD